MFIWWDIISSVAKNTIETCVKYTYHNLCDVRKLQHVSHVSFPRIFIISFSNYSQQFNTSKLMKEKGQATSEGGSM